MGYMYIACGPLKNVAWNRDMGQNCTWTRSQIDSISFGSNGGRYMNFYMHVHLLQWVPLYVTISFNISLLQYCHKILLRNCSSVPHYVYTIKFSTVNSGYTRSIYYGQNYAKLWLIKWKALKCKPSAQNLAAWPRRVPSEHACANKTRLWSRKRTR